MTSHQKHTAQDDEVLKSLAAFFKESCLVYILFAFSVTISIAYTEWKVFNHFVFNAYILQKILASATINTFSAMIVSRVLFLGFNYLKKIPLPFITNTLPKKDSGNENTAIYIATFLIFSITSLPLYTLIAAYYIDQDGTFIRLTFSHFSSNIKIYLSAGILLITTISLRYVYKFKAKEIAIILLMLSFLIIRGVFVSKNKDFKVTANQLITLANSTRQFNPGTIIDKSVAKKMQPLADTLLATAKNDSEKSTAYYWLSITSGIDGNFVDAEKYIDMSLAIEPYSAGSYYQKGMVYKYTDRIELARTAANTCIEIAKEKNHPYFIARCNNLIANTYIETHDYRTARSYLQNAIDADPEQIYYKKNFEDIYRSPMAIPRIENAAIPFGADPTYANCIKTAQATYNKNYDLLCLEDNKDKDCMEVYLWDATTIHEKLADSFQQCFVDMQKN